MSRHGLRAAIAAEAARLIVRGTETDYAAARKRAARWLSRQKVRAVDMPSNDEVQAQIYALTGLFGDSVEVRFAERPTSQTDEHLHPDTVAACRLLLAHLENVILDPVTHPEGDALYHSLQVFELGRRDYPYDEEFLWACLLHDVGYGIDRRDPHAAGLRALGALITERTRFLIENLPAATEYLETGKLARGLRRSEHFDELLQLARHDRDGRVPGASVCTLTEALEYLTGLGHSWDEA